MSQHLIYQGLDVLLVRNNLSLDWAELVLGANDKLLNDQCDLLNSGSVPDWEVFTLDDLLDFSWELADDFFVDWVHAENESEQFSGFFLTVSEVSAHFSFW